MEVGALLRHRLAALGDRKDVLDPRRSHQHRDRRVALVDCADGFPPVRRVADALVAEPVDQPDIELALPVDRQLGVAVAIDDGRRTVTGELFKCAEGAFRIGRASCRERV